LDRVERQDADYRRQNGWPAPQAARNQDNPYQVGHDQVGFGEIWEHQRGQRGADRL